MVVQVALSMVLLVSAGLLARSLYQMRGVATAWIGVENGSYEALIVYGAYREFDITVAGPLYSWCQLEIEGLI